MTRYTRRSFVKRSGSATLGAALGLGLLPSLTRKLHAADNSGGTGIKALVPASTQLEVSNTTNVQGGQLELKVKHVLPATNTCVTPKIAHTVEYTAKFTVNIGGVAYQGLGGWSRTREWDCAQGTVRLISDSGMPGSEPIQIKSASGQTGGSIQVATFPPPQVPPPAPGDGTHGASVFLSNAKSQSVINMWPSLEAYSPVYVCC